MMDKTTIPMSGKLQQADRQHILLEVGLMTNATIDFLDSNACKLDGYCNINLRWFAKQDDFSTNSGLTFYKFENVAVFTKKGVLFIQNPIDMYYYMFNMDKVSIDYLSCVTHIVLDKDEYSQRIQKAKNSASAVKAKTA